MRALTCGIFYDLGPGLVPAVGDYVVTEGRRRLGSAYLIIGARPVRRRRPSPLCRWWLTCQRDSIAGIPASAHVWTLRWYPRRRR